MMLGGYRFLSQDIFHFLPLHPFATKNLNGRLVNDDNLYRGTETSVRNYSPCGNLFVFRERVCERKAIGGDQLESDLGTRKLRRLSR